MSSCDYILCRQSEVDDIELDPLEEDQHSEADERMPPLRRTASSRDELPLTAPERLRTGVMTASSRGALQVRNCPQYTRNIPVIYPQYTLNIPLLAP